MGGGGLDFDTPGRLRSVAGSEVLADENLEGRKAAYNDCHRCLKNDPQ